MRSDTAPPQRRLPQPVSVGDGPISGDEAVVPDRSLKLLLGLAAMLVVMIAASQVSDTVGPIFMALNLMIVVWPVQRWLSKRTNTVVGAIGAGLVAVTVLALLFWSIGWAASALIAELPHYKDKFSSLYDQGIDLLGRFGITATQITDQLKSIDAGSVAGTVGKVLSSVGGGLSLLVVVLSVLLFMVIDSMDFQARLERVGTRHKPVLVLALQSFAQGVRMYWVTSAVFGLIVAVLTYIGLWWIGVPLALVWAVLSFVTNFIPNVGFVIGLVPAALMGLLEKGVFGFVAVIVLYSVLNFVIQSVIQPKITGDAVGVTASVSFISLLVWAFILGPLGALLALPATLLVKALLIDSDPQARWLNAFISSNPKTSLEEPLFDTRAQVQPVDPLVPQEAPADDRTFDGADPDPQGHMSAPTEGETGEGSHEHHSPATARQVSDAEDSPAFRAGVGKDSERAPEPTDQVVDENRSTEPTSAVETARPRRAETRPDTATLPSTDGVEASKRRATPRWQPERNNEGPAEGRVT